MAIESENTFAGIEEGSMVLLLSPLANGCDEEACLDLLSISEDTNRTVMFISMTRAADDVVDLWMSHFTDAPSRMVIISAVDQATSEGMSTEELLSGLSPTVIPLDHPGNLTEFGVRLTDQLVESNADETRAMVCIHSLTALLQYVSLDELFRFLQTFHGQIKSVGGVAHCHLNPAVHDETTTSTLRLLFDRTVVLDNHC